MTIKKTLSGIALVVALALGVVGCDKTEIPKNTTYEMYGRSADHLEQEIRKIAVYQGFNDGRYGVSYKTFTDIAGIKRELSEDANDLGVWVEVIPKTRPYASLQQGIMRESEDEKGRVRFDIPYKTALEINGKLAKYRDEKLGIERLDPDFWKGIPPGDY
ncbi:hypothetical protein K9L97_01775 [Candidatus Woesearchaeota archaeon]|nr:hypothetical protein [Candidatus Woesearchaeota archaeon]